MGNFLNRRQFLKRMSLGTASMAAIPLIEGCNNSSKKRPNIIFMVADNLGREAVGYYGSNRFQTPNLNRMAAEGIVFENCLIASPLCAPARCGWNTGRHPFRVGINSQPYPADPESGLALEEVTIAEVLKEAGYHTALIGKWNLGYDIKFNPVNQGYNEYYGCNAGHADYYTHLYNKDMKVHFYRGLEPVNDDGYFDQLFTDEAIKFLHRRKRKSKPFYLNLCFYAPHGPYQAPPGYYHSKDPHMNYRYMIEYLDTCVGRVIDEVDRLEMAKDTLIVFLSDQGGSEANGYDRTLWENGLKVICNARWKDKIAAGTRVQTPWVHYDLFPTFIALGHGTLPNDRMIDGKNIWSMFEGEEMAHTRILNWTYGDEDAIRVGDWKLHTTKGEANGLFHLAEDPEEKNDVSLHHPKKVTEMLALHAEWKVMCEKQQTSKARSGKRYSNRTVK